MSVSTPVLARAAHVGLWALVGFAAVTGPLALASRQGGVVAAEPVPVAAPAAVTAFAELFVAAYVEAGEGEEERLAAFTDAVPDLRGVQPGAREVARTAVASAAPVHDGYWSVVVAAVVVTPAAGGRPAVRYFATGVLETSDGIVAAALPAQVEGPRRGRRPALAGPSPTVPSDGDPLADTVTQFFAAYLAGQGDLGRYVVLGGQITPVEPVPYSEVAVDRLAVVDRDEHTARVRAIVHGIDKGGARVVLNYSVRLDERDGRWEVASLSGAPDLAAGATRHRRPQPSTAETEPFDPLPAESDTNKGDTPQ